MNQNEWRWAYSDKEVILSRADIFSVLVMYALTVRPVEYAFTRFGWGYGLWMKLMNWNDRKDTEVLRLSITPEQLHQLREEGPDCFCGPCLDREWDEA